MRSFPDGRASPVGAALFEPLECRRLLDATATAVGIQPTAAVNVSNDDSAWQIDHVLRVNPNNPQHLVAASRRIRRTGLQSGIGDQILFDLSRDGGAGWKTMVIGDAHDHLGAGYRFNPMLAFDSSGRLFLSYLMNGSAGLLTVLAASQDGGGTFDDFRVVGTNADIAAIDTGRTTTGEDVLYIVQRTPGAGLFEGAVRLLGLRDGGITFSEPVPLLNEGVSGEPDEYPSIRAVDVAAGDDGSVHVTWHRHVLVEATPFFGGQVFYDVDEDGLFAAQDSFGTDLLVADLPNRSLYYETVHPQRAGISTRPVIALDPDDGAAYVAYNAATTGTRSLPPRIVRTTISVAKVKEGILTESFDASANSAVNFAHEIATDGPTVAVAYYSNSGAPTNREIRPILAISRDTGESFSREVITKFSSYEFDGFTQDYGDMLGLAVRGLAVHVVGPLRRPTGGFDLDSYYIRSQIHAGSAPAAFAERVGAESRFELDRTLELAGLVGAE